MKSRSPLANALAALLALFALADSTVESLRPGDLLHITTYRPHSSSDAPT